MKRNRNGNWKRYEEWYDEWMRTHGEPPSRLDFSDDERERSCFAKWANYWHIELKPAETEASQRFRQFYDEWMQTRDEPPSAIDFSDDKRERDKFRAWASYHNVVIKRRTYRDGGVVKSMRSLMELAEMCEPYSQRDATIEDAANDLGISIEQAKLGYWMCEDDPTDVEVDPRACEPEYAKELCDELRERDFLPPKLLPEEWPRYLEIRKKHDAKRRR